MSIVKFEKDGSVHKCKLIRCSNCIVEIFLNDNIENNVLTSGFVILNENNFTVQGNYKSYTTLYQSFEDSDRHYKLSNDGSVYVAPEPVSEQEPYVPTKEELELQEKNQKIDNLNFQISILKKQLTSSDYKIIKSYEYYLVDKEIEYDIDALHAERDDLRKQINALEQELNDLHNDE